MPKNINSLSSSAEEIKNAKVVILKNSGSTIKDQAVRSYADGDVDILTRGFANLKALVVSDSTKIIGENVFVRNYSLKYVKLPDNMWNGSSRGKIGYQAFGYARALENINLPAGVMIQGNVFKGASTLEFYENDGLIYEYGSTSEYYAYGASTAVGERVIMTVLQQKQATLTRAATLAQAVADTAEIRVGTATENDVKNLIEAAYKDKNANITANWKSFEKTNSNSRLNAVLLLNDGTATVPIVISRDEDIAFLDINLGKYTLTPEFDINTKEYTATVPNAVSSLIVNIKLNNGAKNVSVTGTTLEVGSNNLVTVSGESINGTAYEYKITVTRKEPATIEEIKSNIVNALTEQYYTNNSSAINDITALAEKVIEGENFKISVTDFYRYKAINGATENGGTSVLVPGRNGYLTATIKVDDISNNKSDNVAIKAIVTPIMEDYIFKSVSSKNDFQISDDGKTLLSYEGDAEKLVIPEGVKYIDELYFFSDPNNVKCLVLPDSLKQLPLALCSGMRNLEVVVMGDKVVDAEDDTFARCVKLKYVKLSENLPDISNNMFSNTLSLSQLYIPQSVTLINSNSFYRSLVRDITITASITKVRDNAFAWCVNNANYFTGAAMGALVTTEEAAKINSEIINIIPDQGKSKRYITILNKDVEIVAGAFNGDTSWGFNTLVYPKDSTADGFVNELLDNNVVKKNAQIMSMTVAEAVARAQISADGICLTSSGTADDVMKIVKASYLCDDNLNLDWSVPFNKTTDKITGEITITDASGLKYVINLDRPVYAVADTDLSDKDKVSNDDDYDIDYDTDYDYGTDYDYDTDYDFEDTDYNTDNNKNTDTKDDGPKTKTVKVLKKVKMKRPGTPADYSIFGISPWIWIPVISVLALAGIGTGVFFIIKAAKKKKISSNS